MAITIENMVHISDAWKANKNNFRTNLRNPNGAEEVLKQMGISVDEEVLSAIKELQAYDEKRVSEELEDRVSKSFPTATTSW